MKKLLKVFSFVFILLCSSVVMFACGGGDDGGVDTSSYAFYTYDSMPAGIETIGLGDRYSESNSMHNDKSYAIKGESFGIVFRLKEGYYLDDFQLFLNENAVLIEQTDIDERCYEIKNLVVPNGDFTITHTGEPKKYESDITFRFNNSSLNRFGNYSIKYNRKDLGLTTLDAFETTSLKLFLDNIITSDGKTIEDMEFGDIIEFELWSESKTLPSNIANSYYNDNILIEERDRHIASFATDINKLNNHIIMKIYARQHSTNIVFNSDWSFDAIDIANNFGATITHAENNILFSEAYTDSATSVATPYRLLTLTCNNWETYSNAYNDLIVKVGETIFTKSSTPLTAIESNANKFYIDNDTHKISLVVGTPITTIYSDTNIASYGGDSSRANTYKIDFVCQRGQGYISFAEKLVELNMAGKFEDSMLNTDHFTSGTVPVGYMPDSNPAVRYVITTEGQYFNKVIPYFYELENNSTALFEIEEDVVWDIYNNNGTYEIHTGSDTLYASMIKPNVFEITDQNERISYYISDANSSYFVNFYAADSVITSITFTLDDETVITYTEDDITSEVQDNNNAVKIIRIENMSGDYTYQLEILSTRSIVNISGNVRIIPPRS